MKKKEKDIMIKIPKVNPDQRHRDPIVQQKVQELCTDTNYYYIDLELNKQKDNLEYLLRQQRSLEKEIERARNTVEAIQHVSDCLKKEKEGRR